MGNSKLTREKFFSELLVFPDVTIQKIKTAYAFSKYGHTNQVRSDGGRYFDHPKRVAYSLFNEFNVFDFRSVISALLHDVVEDSYILTSYNIEHNFGPDTAIVVHLLGKEEIHKGEGVSMYFDRLKISGNWRAILLKALDRLDNMRTLGDRPREKQIEQVTETRKYIFPLLEYLKNTIPPEYSDVPEKVLSLLTELCNQYEQKRGFVSMLGPGLALDQNSKIVVYDPDH